MISDFLVEWGLGDIQFRSINSNMLDAHIDIRLLSSDLLPDVTALDQCGSSAFWFNVHSNLQYFLDD